MNSKVCYGKTFLENIDFQDTNIKNPIELRYYRIKNKRRYFFNKKDISYGIEVVKKEYNGKRIRIEKETIEKISDKKITIDFILEKLQKFQVTPICLKEVVHDMTHS